MRARDNERTEGPRPLPEVATPNRPGACGTNGRPDCERLQIPSRDPDGVCHLRTEVMRRMQDRRPTFRERHRGLLRFGAFLAGLLGIAAVFIGWDIAAHRFLPDLPTGVRHLSLTLLAAIVTGAVGYTVYRLMRRQQTSLSSVAEQLSGLLETYMANPDSTARFENPHLVQCAELLHCGNESCQLHGRNLLGDRCWQVMALERADNDVEKTSIEIGKCHECEVYRMSCPDKLTELGESFNNLLFLLGQESKRLERLRRQMVEKEKMVSIGQLASGIAHEVANPLSSISSVVQMLKRSGTVEPDTVAQYDLIETHIRRITGIVRKLGTSG
jgi:signal transduction histidine kinase